MDLPLTKKTNRYDCGNMLSHMLGAGTNQGVDVVPKDATPREAGY